MVTMAVEMLTGTARSVYLSGMTILKSTGRRRELGAGLRRLRELIGINGAEMAHLLRWTQTMLSRVESGKRPVSDIEVANYTAVCGVTGDGQKWFLDLANEPDEYRIKPHPGQIPDKLQSLIFHESTAAAIESFEPIFIPGIMQTPDYARALFTATGMADPTDIDDWVDIRMERRRALTRINPAQGIYFVHENALRADVGNARVMNEQMLHLVFVSGRPQCSVRVIPASTGVRGLANNSFQIFGYTEEPSVVHVPNETASEFVEADADLRTYRSLLKRLASVALPDAQSRDVLVRLASDYDRGVARDGGSTAEE